MIVAGRIVTAEQAEAALAAGVCDLVGMTRALIADPDLPRKWRAVTPAMAAGVTDHVWTFRELLTAKFEPLDSQSISG